MGPTLLIRASSVLARIAAAKSCSGKCANTERPIRNADSDPMGGGAQGHCSVVVRHLTW